MANDSNLTKLRPIVMTQADLEAFARTFLAQYLATQTSVGDTGPQTQTIIRTGSLTIDPIGYEATVDGVLVGLKPREFALLLALGRKLGHLLNREVLLQMAWPDPEAVDDVRTVDTHIARLRRRLGVAGRLIRTVTGVGYKLSREPVAVER
ncbi:MAG: winged helix-turn-helix domain-containing protein [Vulcanimicrobiaceae bacterium]